MNRTGRLESIDFWRGCVLCMIFVDHMPGNVFESATPRNYGFSDAAEAFVFLSGLSIALAYGGRLAIGQRLKTLGSLGRRALKLYGAHIALSLAALAIFFSGAAWAGKPDLVEVHGRDLFVDNPGLGLIALVSLGHQLGYFNILPLYIILILFAPALLLMAGFDRRMMLIISGLIYGLARFRHWDFHNWPGPGSWFFDPFAWQFLFAIGIAVGLKLRDGPVIHSRALTAFACSIVIASAIIVTQGGHLIGQQTAWQALYSALDVDKSRLGLVRLLHFLAVAYLIYEIHILDGLRRMPIFRPLTLMGRNSLWVFILISLSSAIWQVSVNTGRHSILFDVGFSVVSLAIIYVATRRFDSFVADREALAA
jgi:hypothetical protein